MALSLRPLLRAGAASERERAARALRELLGAPSPAALAGAAQALGRLAGADACALVRFERLDSARVLGAWSVGTPRYRAGVLLDLDPGAELRRVAEAARSVRVADIAPGSASRVAQLGYRCFVGVPLGGGWGAVALTSVEPGGLGPDVAARTLACLALAGLAAG